MAWAEPYAYGIMGLKPWEFERIDSTRTFMAMLHGAIRRYHLLADLFGHARVDLLMAGGVTFSDRPQPGPAKKNLPTFEKLMGRKPVEFVDPRTPSEVEREAEAERQRELRERHARAELQIWEAQFRAQHPDRVVGDPPPPSEPSPEEPEQSPPA